MRKSKLELYQDILETLKIKPITVDRLSYKTGMDCGVLRQRLNFLIANHLVRERLSNRKAVFAVSERGVAVLRALDIQKRLEDVRDTMLALDTTIRAEVATSEQTHKSE
jgi:predicted transcriptional regulator